MFKTQGEILRELVAQKEFTQEEFAIEMGVSRQTVTVWFKQNSIDKSTLKKAASILKVNATVFDSAATGGVPVLNVEATAGLINLFKNDIHENVIGTIDMPEFKGCDYILKMRGDSMLPILDNCWIGVKEIKSRSDISFGAIYLIVTEEFNLVKYLQPTQMPDKWLMISENKKYPSQEISRKAIKHLFLVKASIRIDYFSF